MEDDPTIKTTLQLNLLAASIFFVGVVLLTQLIIDLTRRPPGGEDLRLEAPAITSVGFREKASEKSYDSFTLFENNGSVYSYWREGETWKSRPLPNYK